MEYVPIVRSNRERVQNSLESQWLTTEMVHRGRVVDMTGADGIVVWERETLWAFSHT